MNKEKKTKEPLKTRLWKGCKVLLFTGVILITLGALVLAEENWRAERAWKKMQQEIADRGEPLTWAELVGPPVPDDENFAMTPLFRPLTGYMIDYSDRGIAISWEDAEAVENASAELPPPSDYRTDENGQIKFEVWRIDFRNSADFELTELSEDPAGDVLSALKKYEQEIVEITDASHRPHLRFIKDEESIRMSAGLKYQSTIRSWESVIQLRASALLGTGRPELAFEDIQTLLRISELWESEPIIISQLVEFATIARSIKLFWLGWTKHQWSNDHLIWFQDYFSKRNVREIAPRSLMGERTLANTFNRGVPPELQETATEESLNLLNRVILLQNYVATHRMFNSIIDSLEESLNSNSAFSRGTINYAQIAGLREYNDSSMSTPTTSSQNDHFGIKHPYTAMAAMLMPGLISTLEKFDRTQTIIDLAMTVCALERYWLDNGEYPEALADLVPEFLSEVPIDLMSGGPFHYSRRDDGWFDLYSVGMNQVDDGGVFLDGRRDENEIDYPWPLPIPQPEGRLF